MFEVIVLVSYMLLILITIGFEVCNQFRGWGNNFEYMSDTSKFRVLMPSFNFTSSPGCQPPSIMPSYSPSMMPSYIPNTLSTEMPTDVPTLLPALRPTLEPTIMPSRSIKSRDSAEAMVDGEERQNNCRFEWGIGLGNMWVCWILIGLSLVWEVGNKIC